MDPLFRVEVLAKTPEPQRLIYAGMHQDYSENFVFEEKLPKETKAGEIAVERLLKGGRGHFGCCEAPSISFAVGYFPHSTMQQITRHRIGTSFDVMSGRYTSKRILDVSDGNLTVEEVFYLRPVGHYTDRKGTKYEYTYAMREDDLNYCFTAACRYAAAVTVGGMSEEHARGIIPFDVRQHWVMSFNARSLMHLLDLRAKADAQLECQQLCELIWPHFEAWMPAIAGWYRDNRWKKARLAP
jgi:thymidylate synthase (FAD)